MFPVLCGLILMTFAGSPPVHAFPEIVRAQYTNCTTCHVSPTGGGLLTDYGRNLSSELLSTWGNEKEARVGHGWLGGERKEEQEPDNLWIGVGGDIRGVQSHVENKFRKEGRFIWMQAMLDLGLRLHSWTGVISLGRFDSLGKGRWKPDSERYYLMKQVNDENLMRAGRFIPAFGINLPEHISPTRGGPRGNGLGFGIAQERDAVEWHYIDENWNAAAGFAKGPQDHLSPMENAVYGQIWRAFADRSKVGLSLWFGRLPQARRQLAGVHALLGFTSRVYLVTEVDWQFLSPDSGAPSVGIFGYHKLGYEFMKGLHAVLIADHLQGDLKDSTRYMHHWGGGVQFYPRPHFELSGVWTRELLKSRSASEGDYAWLLLHYYL